jgi:hypothetical protein
MAPRAGDETRQADCGATRISESWKDAFLSLLALLDLCNYLPINRGVICVDKRSCAMAATRPPSASAAEEMKDAALQAAIAAVNAPRSAEGLKRERELLEVRLSPLSREHHTPDRIQLPDVYRPGLYVTGR